MKRLMMLLTMLTTILYAPRAGDPYVYVRDYGAKCDGITNDVAAFSAAFTVAEKRMNGTIVIPTGDCIIDAR